MRIFIFIFIHKLIFLFFQNLLDNKQQLDECPSQPSPQKYPITHIDRQNKLYDQDQLPKEQSSAQKMTSSQSTKIQQKQADRFDPSKLRQNGLIIKQNDNKGQLFDLGDEQEETQNKTEVFGEQQSEIKEESQIAKESSEIKEQSRFRRKVGRNKAKLVSSDQQENIQEDQEQFSNLPQQTSILQGPKIQVSGEKYNVFSEGSNILSEASTLRKLQSQAQSQIQQKPQIKKNTSESPPRPSQHNQPKYTLIHVLLNKAGYNKQDRKKLIYTPMRPNQYSFVYFKRHQNGFSQTYQAIGQDQRPIIFSQSQRGCIGCNYYISISKEMNKNSPHYLGKLRGNAAGSTYLLFDGGKQPSKNMDRSEFRVSMAHIQYQSNFLGMKGPRKLKVVVPKVQEVDDFDMFKMSQQQSLLALQGSSSVISYRNKQPKWNQRLNSYALNFGGRVKQASIKNFILTDNRNPVETEERQANALVFGKIDESTFALKFGHPLCLFQAFGIALSQFDYKLTCE